MMPRTSFAPIPHDRTRLAGGWVCALSPDVYYSPKRVHAPGTNTVTRLLQEWSRGNGFILNELMELVYAELHRLAAGFLRNERPGHTLQPTALIHEAYLRLVAQGQPEWESRSHFYSFAAHLMRQILVDHARTQKAEKRGGLAQKVPIDGVHLIEDCQGADLIAVDKALTELEAFDQRKARVLELRYFAGMSVEEIATTLGVSKRTAERELRLSRAWLYREFTG
jgi:RNA polymerase sigma-70 factor (ECF subfamily)